MIIRDNFVKAVLKHFVIRVSVKRLSPLHFLCTQCLQSMQKMLLLPTLVPQTAHGDTPELCFRSSPVFPALLSALSSPLHHLIYYFSVKVSVIGSRDQLCIHEQVKKEQNNTNKVGHYILIETLKA